MVLGEELKEEVLKKVLREINLEGGDRRGEGGLKGIQGKVEGTYCSVNVN